MEFKLADRRINGKYEGGKLVGVEYAEAFHGEDDYEKRTGLQMPVFDLDLPESAVELPPGTYVFPKRVPMASGKGGDFVYDSNGQPTTEEREYPDGVRINIATRVTFPKWDPKPVVPQFQMGPSLLPVDSDALSQRSSVLLLENELLKAGFDVGEPYIQRAWLASGYMIQYPATSDWRVWVIPVNGTLRYASELLADRYDGGVGSSGKWEMGDRPDSSKYLRFVTTPNPPTMISSKGEVEPPLLLKPGEHLAARLESLTKVVYIESGSSTDNATSEPTMAELKARIAELEDQVAQLTKLLGGTMPAPIGG